MLDDREWGRTNGGPLEIAQIVWLHALELVVDSDDDLSDALELAQMAGNDPAVLQHALFHGRTMEPRDLSVARAIHELETAIELVTRAGPSRSIGRV